MQEVEPTGVVVDMGNVHEKNAAKCGGFVPCVHPPPDGSDEGTVITTCEGVDGLAKAKCPGEKRHLDCNDKVDNNNCADKESAHVDIKDVKAREESFGNASVGDCLDHEGSVEESEGSSELKVVLQQDNENISIDQASIELTGDTLGAESSSDGICSNGSSSTDSSKESSILDASVLEDRTVINDLPDGTDNTVLTRNIAVVANCTQQGSVVDIGSAEDKMLNSTESEPFISVGNTTPGFIYNLMDTESCILPNNRCAHDPAECNPGNPDTNRLDDGRLAMSPEQSSDSVDSEQDGDGCPHPEGNSVRPSNALCPGGFNTEGCSELLDPNIQFDEDLNPSSLPFESLNSSFQYSVLIDSCSEDENEDSSSFTNPSDCEFGGTSDKLRMAFGSVGGGDSLDFLSTEAENQLECCDQWSLGSCSLAGYECRTLEKRRRSLETRDEDGRLVTCDISKLGSFMTVVKEDRFDNTSNDEDILAKDVDSFRNCVESSNLSEQCAISLVKECENKSVQDTVTHNVNSADGLPLSAVSMPCEEKTCDESSAIPVAQSSMATEENLDASTSVVCNNVSNLCHTTDDRETDEQAVTTASNDSLPNNASPSHSSSPAVDIPAVNCTIVASADIDHSYTEASDASHKPTLPAEGGTESSASGDVSSNQDLQVTSPPARGDPFRRGSGMQSCTVMLPPPIDEEPDLLLEEGADLSTFVKDSRSSHSSGHSGHTVGGDDDFTEFNSMIANDRIYESVQQSDHLTSNSDTPDTIIPDDEPTKTKLTAPSLTTTKPELRSYFGKSMLPGLSGLHGLSSLRHSAHNLSKITPSSVSSQNRASTGNTCLESSSSKPSDNGGIHGSTKVSPCSAANGSNREEIAWVSRRLQAHRQLSSSDSWGSEDFESYSSNEEDSGVGKEDGGVVKPCEVSMNSSKLSTDSKVSADSNSTVGSSSSGVVSTAGREKLKARLLRKREQWRERRQSSSKEFRVAGGRKDSKEGKEGCDGPLREGSIEDVHAVSGGADTGKLSRWFSLRKSVNYEVERKPGTLATPTGTLGSTHPLPNRTLPKSLSENDGSNIPSNDHYPNGVPNSSTLSSISSFSSNSSSSTNSSSSSFPHHHNSHHNNLRMPQLLELEERMSELEACTNPSNFYRSSCGGLGALGANTFQRKHQPPSLPPIPPGLAPEQIKRRHIVASIVHSENNYVATLHRLVREYRKPLDDSKPPILSQAKVATLFHYVHEILQCHTMFRIALTDCVRHWDRDEKIGDVFFASFSKGVVLDIYSEFINNFTRAMELAKLESRKKSAFADFLKMRQITSPDRLSFFGMMVKPVQRFPQFILFLQDLLKHTPKGHHDRMSLQLALTQLESLAENLNEQKRESEQHQAFKATLKQINSKFALRNISEGNRCLIRQDDVTKLEFGPNGLIKQTKERRLFLTTDTVICVSVVPKTSDDFNSLNERLSLKWVHPITEIEVQESNSSLTLSRLLAAGLSHRSSSTTNSSSALTKQHSTNSTSTTTGGGDSVYDIYNNMATTSLEESEAMVGAICAEMNDLMHDYQVVSRIAGLVGSLKGSYDGLNSSSLQGVMGVIQQNIQARDDRMSWLDGCCLQIRAGKEKEVITFHVQDPTVKKDWIIELRLAQLAVSSVNSPAWDSGDLSSQPPSRRPLFVTALPILHAAHHTQVVCGCQYPIQELPKSVPARGVLGAAGRRGGKTHTSVWLCSTDGVTSHITRYVTHLGGLRECIRVSLREMCVTGMLHVPPAPLPSPIPGSSSPVSPSPPSTAEGRPPLALDTVWIGTLQNRLLVYSGSASDAQEELCSTDLPAAVSSLIYHCEQVFIGLTNGQLLVYQRGASDGCWQVSEPVSISLSDGAAVTALLPLSAQLYAAVADTVMVLDCATLQITKQLSVHHGQSVSLLAHSGIGLWVCEAGSSTVCLYHTESCRHLQDIDLAPCVTRLLGAGVASTPVIVTALVVSRGLLWVGTSVGVTLTLPLPRLQGVPIISGRPTLSYHAHTGPVTFLMTLMPPEYFILPKKISDKTKATEEKNSCVETKQPDDDSGVSESNSNEDACSTVGKKCSEVELRNMIRKASTLPRGFGGGGTLSVMHEGTLGEMAGNLGVGVEGSDDGEVMGLCGELLRHWGDESTVPGGDAEDGDPLRRSDPSLSCMSSTLDRRLRLRAGRPRSLDLSSASIDSKVSAATTSSGSEDGHTAVQSRQSTIHENLAHNPIPEGDLSRKNSARESVEMTESGIDCTDKAPVSMGPELKSSEELMNEAANEEKLKKMSTCSNDSCIETPGSSDRADKMDSKICETPKPASLENSPEQAKSTIESNVLPPTLAESSSACKSSFAKNGKESKSRGSHRRSSSDITQKSLSSSSSNISSLYYDGDVDIFDTTKSSSSSSSNPTKSLKRVSGELTGKEVSGKANKIDSSIKEPVHVSRKSSITNTLNRNISTLSRSPTAKSKANGKGSATAPGRGGREAEQPRTVLVLAGGQGYKCIREDTPTNGPPHNNTDAHMLVWEMKL